LANVPEAGEGKMEGSLDGTIWFFNGEEGRSTGDVVELICEVMPENLLTLAAIFDDDVLKGRGNRRPVVVLFGSAAAAGLIATGLFSTGALWGFMAGGGVGSFAT
jgi:hypothetical protein